MITILINDYNEKSKKQQNNNRIISNTKNTHNDINNNLIVYPEPKLLYELKPIYDCSTNSIKSNLATITYQLIQLTTSRQTFNNIAIHMNSETTHFPFSFPVRRNRNWNRGSE